MLEIDLNWWDYLSLFLILFVGIPHGALDGAISITLGYSKKISLQFRFLISYLLFSTMILVLLSCNHSIHFHFNKHISFWMW